MAQRKNTPAERFLEHLYEIFQVEPQFYPMDSSDASLPSVTALVYQDIPEPGFMTGITYGLSLGEHLDWKNGRPELCITVESGEIAWATIAAFVANGLRRECPFTYASTIRLHGKIHSESEMDAFFVFAPSILKKEQYADIDIGTNYRIQIAGFYPIYESEIEVLDRIGLKNFWHHPAFDPFDVKRKPILG